jgi:hypothetical protein
MTAAIFRFAQSWIENIFENAGQNGQENLPEKKAERSLSLF